MNTARPPDSAVSGASAPEAAAAPVAGGLGAVTEAASADVPEATAAVAVPSGSPVSDFMIHRVARALRERVRYRYVAPRVLREGESFRIQSPCCSRNIDPSGGLIDIALLTPGADGASSVGVASGAGSASGAGRWSLSARDHAAGAWRVCLQGEALETVLDALCVDSERQFWP